MYDDSAITAAHILMEMANGPSSRNEEVDSGNTTNTPVLLENKTVKETTEVEVSLDVGMSHDYLGSNGLLCLIYHLLSAICFALISARIKNNIRPNLTILQIVEFVRSNPGELKILELKDSLFYSIRHCLTALSVSREEYHIALLRWRPLVAYEKGSKSWSWNGPVPLGFLNSDNMDVSKSLCDIPQELLSSVISFVSDWLQKSQATLHEISNLPTPPSVLRQGISMEERFKEMKSVKSYVTIGQISEEVKEYFQKEETLRYSIPDRAFLYTALDGMKSAVVPLINSVGESAKAQKHHIVKDRRPPQFTLISMVRDAVARLPGRVGTKADICVLARDSQFINEEIDDKELWLIVGRTLERLRYENDPCVTFDKNKHLWFYLHGERGLEDFEDDATGCRKKDYRS